MFYRKAQEDSSPHLSRFWQCRAEHQGLAGDLAIWKALGVRHAIWQFKDMIRFHDFLLVKLPNRLPDPKDAPQHASWRLRKRDIAKLTK